MSAIAMLAGGILSVLLRNLVDGRRTDTPHWRSTGALVLGSLTGAAVGGSIADRCRATMKRKEDQ
ncbi:hypothetical protein GCM10022243_31560 [Saccharothrix violaceirubra]|uniref:Putative membrane protein YfcA n=1 Tax=Saccharothrix violaceirubra TaxID=413306 RepID=A0A7W7WX57_9PSEU|nr:hypothetical protein [Saccharothrix violaceirubra]MBB4966781.1 putative membrane protein YfcA [Saccharothrix violaceirubra]